MLVVIWFLLSAASAMMFVPFHPAYYRKSPFCSANPTSEACTVSADPNYIDCECEVEQDLSGQCPPEMLLGSCWQKSNKACLSTFSQLTEDVRFSVGRKACASSISKCQGNATCSALVTQNRSRIFQPSDVGVYPIYREVLQCLAQHIEICPCTWETCTSNRSWVFYVYAVGFPILWGVCLCGCVMACFVCLCKRWSNTEEAIPATWDSMAKPCHPESFVQVPLKQLPPKRSCGRCKKALTKGSVIHCEACQTDLCKACLFFFGVRSDLLAQAEAALREPKEREERERLKQHEERARLKEHEERERLKEHEPGCVEAVQIHV